MGPLLDRLGGLPLALVQAGAYIGATDLTVEEYIAYYDKTWAELMTYQDRYPLQEYAERSVLTTRKMSYEQARAVKPEAARLLDQWAFSHPRDVSYELVGNYRRPSKGSERAREGELMATNKLSFQDSVGVLAQYSLVNNTEGAGNFSIHAVVHDWSLYNIVDDQAREQLCAQAVRMVAASMPSSNDASGLQAAQKLLYHARMTGRRLTKMNEVTGLHLQLHRIANFMQDWESSQDVETLYVQALEGKEQAWGAKHTSTLDTVYNLGNLYRGRGEVAQAKKMYGRAVDGYRDVDGDHEADIVYLRRQLSLLRRTDSTDGGADRGCQAVDRQPLFSAAGVPTRGSRVPASDLADARSVSGEVRVRHRKRDLLLRVLKR